MTSNAKKIIAAAAAILLSAVSFAGRTRFSGLPESVFIDLPEGFRLENHIGDTSFLLQSTVLPVKLAVRIYETQAFPSAHDALSASLEKLGLKHETGTVSWQGGTAALAIHSGTVAGEESFGYSAAAAVPETGRTVTLISWCPEKLKESCSIFMGSIIDGLCIGSESCFSPGLFTSSLFPESDETEKITLSIGGKTISTQLRSGAGEAAQDLISREYVVLGLYLTSPLWKEALTRYYRMIFKDSCGRLKEVSFDIYRTLAPHCADETDFAQKLLSWTQGFAYERNQTESDFTALPLILAGAGSDCDSRSMLIAVILQSVHIDSILFVSREYSHAIAGLVSDHPGFGFKAAGKLYLTGDTTVTGATWGTIAADLGDSRKWIPVELP